MWGSAAQFTGCSHYLDDRFEQLGKFTVNLIKENAIHFVYTAIYKSPIQGT